MLIRSRNGTEESGFSLLEVLAALVVLSVVSLVLTSFFTNALTYAKGNQSKTVMVNLARNALFYMEKQSFEPIQAYFADSSHTAISCRISGCDALVSPLAEDASILQQILNPNINGVQYTISVIYQREMHNDMLHDPDQKNMAEELLPVMVRVDRAGGTASARNRAEVEGYIASERVR
ncbi:prepilin-type N-terminal cleavage/methylation domain-containing protein [Paenibacillus glycanilyticus]|uniref:prepilin-type N-terminal cleavage/methylation domain-containing protein n=1 Tax=Paenibacillus glycanilyticus TaxID=126569 RepID=UPI00203CC208|nr:prepilin-type N-terminal cleavage/methylation domain-containing protein [Paenibacillus glycanilyticus]MCM3627144.1 prepilin-type N-terminal cleavage/methylation domain-containing protein [Paenibacillus glycanilyticus]